MGRSRQGNSKYEAARSILTPTPIHLTDTPNSWTIEVDFVGVEALASHNADLGRRVRQGPGTHPQVVSALSDGITCLLEDSNSAVPELGIALSARLWPDLEVEITTTVTTTPTNWT
jgi:hypothetical protein